MQMSMMVTPNFNKELHYLNKEDRLLRWLLVKQRNTKYGMEFLDEDDAKSEMNQLRRRPQNYGRILDGYDEDDDDDDNDDDDDYEEYEVNQDEDDKEEK